MTDDAADPVVAGMTRRRVVGTLFGLAVELGPLLGATTGSSF
jgi:hypothetical protein